MGNDIIRPAFKSAPQTPETRGIPMFVRGSGMTTISKLLAGLCVILLMIIAYLSREEVTNAGPRNLQTRIHNRWTGTVVIGSSYSGVECKQIYPPLDANGK